MAIYRLEVKHGSNGAGSSAGAHSQYICREQKYERTLQQDLVHKEHVNMPEWAEENPIDFWEAADTYERKNGRTYSELVLSLPRELTKESAVRLVQGLAREQLGEKHVYTLAIHVNKSLDGGRNPHAHLMFCNRELDGIARGPEQFFKRHNARQPERGGAKKSRVWSFDSRENDRLGELRIAWERHVNLALERAKLDIRVDRRSLKARGITDVEPEPKLGPIVTQELRQGRGLDRETATDVMELREYRQLRAERERLERDLKLEEAKLYRLAQERKKRRGMRLTPGENETPEEQQLRADEYKKAQAAGLRQNPEAYKRTVDYVMDRQETEEGVEFRFKRTKKLAFVDHGHEIIQHSMTAAAMKSAAQVSKEKGWETVQVWGSEEFRRGIWLELKLQGLQVVGYEANQLDLDKLSQRLQEREALRLKERAAAQAERLRNYPEQQRQLREGLESRGAFSIKASDLVVRIRKEVLVNLQAEKQTIWRARETLGLRLDPKDIYRQTYEYPPPLTQEEARKQALDTVAGEQFVQDRARAVKLETEIAECRNRRALLQVEFERQSLAKRLMKRKQYERANKALSAELGGLLKEHQIVAGRQERRQDEMERPAAKAQVKLETEKILAADLQLQEQRADVDKRLERVAAEMKESLELQRVCRKLGDERLEVRWTQDKRIIQAERPEQLQEMLKRAEVRQQLERKLHRGKGGFEL